MEELSPVMPLEQRLQVILKQEQLGAKGVLYYTLETDGLNAIKKMIVLQ